MPLSELFGGRRTDAVDVAWTLASGDTQRDIAEAEAMLDARRHRAFKLKIGSNAVADDVAHVVAIKRALGERGDVRVDVNQAWSETDAIWACARLAEAGVSLVEQPIAATNRAGLKRLTRLAQVPIMADEALHGPVDAFALAQDRAADVFAVKIAQSGGLHGAASDIDRVLAGDDRQRRDLDLLAELAQLLLRGRAPRVERGHQNLLVLALGQALGDLGRSRRLAGALQADHHDDDRRRCVEVDGDTLGAEHLDQLVMDDLDDHLAGLDRLQHRGADGLLAHLVGEGPHHFERHVGLEQRTAHLAQRRRDISLGKRAAAGEAVQDGAKALLQGLKH